MSEVVSSSAPSGAFHAYKVPDWVEAVASCTILSLHRSSLTEHLQLVVTILLAAIILTRRRNLPIIPSTTPSERTPLIAPSFPPSNASKKRHVFCITIRTPDSSRFASHLHSRLLAKFPFLVEAFYWAITFYLYRLAATCARVYYGGAEALWNAAQQHGVDILEAEARVLGTYDPQTPPQQSRWLEWRVQQWFMRGMEDQDWRGVWLSVLNRSYSMIHIPGTVAFIAWYYASAPTFARFATIRRTMSLLNAIAFLIFALYPCMPPRLLPPEHGFVDTVHEDDARSVFMKGNFANALAAMPSMHFGYAFCIGCVFLYESGVMVGLRRKLPISEARHIWDEECESVETFVSSHEMPGCLKRTRRSVAGRMMFFGMGIFYPAWILLTILATANHYLLDAVVAMFMVLIAYLCNRVLLNCLPLEDWLLWALRLEKPEPTTGV